MRTMTILIILIGFLGNAVADDGARVIHKMIQLEKKDQPAISTSRTAMALEFKPITAVKINRPLSLERLKPIIPAEETVDPEGPNPAATLDLGDIIDDSSLLEDLGTVCGWDSHLIFQDIAAAHVFYYIPRVFLLKHDLDGYRLNVQYNARAEEGEPSVMITAEMAAPHRTGDVRLLKAILRQALELKTGDPLTIKSLPGLGATADLQALSTGLMLQSERIHLTPPAHLKQLIRMTLSLTQDEAEEVLAQIARDGIVGALNVNVGETAVPIPVRIQYGQFSGTALDGFDKWADGETVSSIRNISYFPVSINAINGYRLNGGKLERLSKKLKSIKIDPGKSRSLKLPAAKKLLGENLAVSWMATDIDGACETCLKSIDMAVRKGVGASPGENVHLEAIPSLFDEFGIYKLIVHIQSPYLTVEGNKVSQEAVALTVDENESRALTIYIPTDKGADPLLYKYRLEAVTETGETLMTENWEKSRKLSQFFGSSQVEALFDAQDEGMAGGSGE